MKIDMDVYTFALIASAAPGILLQPVLPPWLSTPIGLACVVILYVPALVIAVLVALGYHFKYWLGNGLARMARWVQS